MSPILDGDPIWHLDWLTLDPNTPDANGTTWILENQVGFFDGATPRMDSSQIVEKVNRHGAMMGPNYMKERIITLSGKTFAKTQNTLGTALAQLGGICTDPNLTYKLSCDTNLGQIYANVMLDAQTQISPFALNPSFQWSIQLIAPDPRKYSSQTYTANIGLPQANTGDGLNFAEPQNLVTNPDFGTNTTGWTAYAATTLTRPAAPGTPPVTFTNAALCTSTSAATNGIFTALQALDTNSWYVTGSAYLYSTTAKTATIVVGWYNASNALVSETTQAQALTANTWTRVVATGTPPAGATQVRIEARETAAGSGSTFYASAFQLEYNNGATPYTKTLTGVYFGDSSLSNNGLLFGATGNNASGLGTLLNGGSAPVQPVYTLYGPLTTPVLSASQPDGTTALMQYNGTLSASDVLVITPSAPSVMLNGASRRYLLNPANFGGFSIPAANMGTGQPGRLSVGLSHSGAINSGGYVTAIYQYAYF